MNIVVWNIEKFTNVKFEEYEYAPKAVLSTKRKRQYLDAQNRLDYMGRVVNAGGNAPLAVPDVVAVIETLVDRVTELGQPMGELDSAGVLRFLKLIKDTTNNSNWRVVPPIKCNPPKPDGFNEKWAQEEAVAVFYNSTTVTFEGPDYWNGNAIQRGAGGAKAYPKPWKLAGNTGGTTRAGRVAHTDKAGKEVLFPRDRNRRPFMVDFREVVGGRLFRCLFMHTSPQQGISGTHVRGTSNIANIADMNPKDNTTANPNYYIACGDFNVNMYNFTEPKAAYTPLTKLNYKAVLRDSNTVSTHFWRNDVAEPTQPLSYQQREIIDNFFVLKNSTSQPAITTYTRTSINTVDGVPWGTAMQQDLQTINAIIAGPNVPGPIATFRQWENFRCIISTSDHLPIYLRIP